MYLTGQRVRDLAGRMGINTLLYRHAGQNLPGLSCEQPDVESVVATSPGTIVSEHLEIPPGKNHVMSYLDVVADDAVASERIERVLMSAEREVESKGVPFLFAAEGVGVRFHLEGGLERYERQEFQALKEQCLRLLGARAMDAWQTCEPLIIDVTVSEEEARYALDSVSMQRVRDKCPSGHPARSVIIQHDTKDAFERIHGDVIPHMILALTGLRLEDVIELGGVRVKDAATGKILREWPKRSSQ